MFLNHVPHYLYFQRSNLPSLFSVHVLIEKAILTWSPPGKQRPRMTVSQALKRLCPNYGASSPTLPLALVVPLGPSGTDKLTRAFRFIYGSNTSTDSYFTVFWPSGNVFNATVSIKEPPPLEYLTTPPFCWEIYHATYPPLRTMARKISRYWYSLLDHCFSSDHHLLP